MLQYLRFKHNEKWLLLINLKIAFVIVTYLFIKSIYKNVVTSMKLKV